MNIRENAEMMLQILYRQAPVPHHTIAYWLKRRDLGKKNSKSLNVK